MEKYEIIKQKLCNEIDTIGRKLENGGDINDNELTRLDKLAHAMKSLATVKAMEDAEEYNGMSGRMGRSYNHGGNMGNNSFADGYSRGYADARNSYNDGRMEGHSGVYHPMYPNGYYDGRNW